MSHRFQNISVRRVWCGRLAALFGAIFTAASISSAEPDAPAADPKAPDGSKLVHLTLISDKATIAPGGAATIGVRLQMEPGWHTYWKNPGDSGTSTSVQFKLTGVDGATVGDRIICSMPC